MPTTSADTKRHAESRVGRTAKYWDKKNGRCRQRRVVGAASLMGRVVPITLSTGMRLYKYQLKRLIGQGSFGEVWLARDLTLQREFAVKVLKPGFSVDERLREAQIGNQLTHTNLVHVHQADVVPPQWPRGRRLGHGLPSARLDRDASESSGVYTFAGCLADRAGRSSKASTIFTRGTFSITTSNPQTS